MKEKLKKYTVLTNTASEDIVSAGLFELGIQGVEIENAVPLTKEEQEGMFIDFPPELPEDTGESRLSFYLPEEEEGLLEAVKGMLEELREFTDIGAGTISESAVEEGWESRWKEFFHSFSVDGLLIRPSWERETEPSLGQTVIEIDPGMSFGTGKHETTFMVLQQLQKYLLPGMSVLDLGTGSGILSIAAGKLGAERITGTDIDEQCIVSAYENWERNGLRREEVSFRKGNLLTEEDFYRELCEEPYDLILANILAEVLIPMAPLLRRLLKSGGYIITSGIIDSREDKCVRAFSDAGLNIVEINHMGEWVNITLN
ncbi:MAG: 50S ribosomal protein L11 methyltransferase [Lachnospiraceae bacterium]|nr:50S ribosomal protein L11 methyltransferase [Lachnospiraceae bacterium]